MVHARDYIDRLAGAGRHHFTAAEAREALGGTANAATLALRPLSKQGLIASPARGFYVIVPPEYRRLGSLPPEQFVPALMERQGLVYYAGLLSAAQLHGAAHQRPQVFQVAVGKARRGIEVGRVRVAFYVRRRIEEVPTVSVNTPRGSLRVSSVEATALDLVGYERLVGGLDQAATVLAELAERIEPKALAAAATAAPMPWAQRLGWLLEHVGAGEKADVLKAYVAAAAPDATPLLPAAPHAGAPRDKNWRLRINADVEAEA